MKKKIQLADLHEYANVDYRATQKQIGFIEGLMKQKGVHSIFKHYFQIKGRNVTTTITKKEATKFIKVLLANEDYCFVEHIPKMEEGELKNPIPILPPATFSSDVPKKLIQTNKF